MRQHRKYPTPNRDKQLQVVDYLTCDGTLSAFALRENTIPPAPVIARAKALGLEYFEQQANIAGLRGFYHGCHEDSAGRIDCIMMAVKYSNETAYRVNIGFLESDNIIPRGKSNPQYTVMESVFFQGIAGLGDTHGAILGRTVDKKHDLMLPITDLQWNEPKAHKEDAKVYLGDGVNAFSLILNDQDLLPLAYIRMRRVQTKHDALLVQELTRLIK